MQNCKLKHKKARLPGLQQTNCERNVCKLFCFILFYCRHVKSMRMHANANRSMAYPCIVEKKKRRKLMRSKIHEATTKNTYFHQHCTVVRPTVAARPATGSAMASCAGAPSALGKGPLPPGNLRGTCRRNRLRRVVVSSWTTHASLFHRNFTNFHK